MKMARNRSDKREVDSFVAESLTGEGTTTKDGQRSKGVTLGNFVQLILMVGSQNISLLRAQTSIAYAS
ncbi:UNVERIFIED_CONTAM: hypothetical protein FKN15_027077 [Acipenser sinensis]